MFETKTKIKRGGVFPIRRWTPEEDEIVREQYKHNRLSGEVLSVMLHRSADAIRGHAAFLSRPKRSGKKFHVYTPEEDARIELLLQSKPIYLVAQEIGVSEAGLTCHMFRQSMTRRDYYTGDNVMRILGVGYKTFSAWISSGALKYQKTRPAEPGRGNTPYFISYQDLRNFIINYPEELSGRNVDLVVLVDLLTNYRAENKSNSAALLTAKK